MIDRIRLMAAAKIQLSTLKRKTCIEHYNSICRHAFCLSFTSDSNPPQEDFNFNGELEIEWRVFTGGNDVFLNLLITRLVQENSVIAPSTARMSFMLHLHRSLPYLAVEGMIICRVLTCNLGCYLRVLFF